MLNVGHLFHFSITTCQPNLQARWYLCHPDTSLKITLKQKLDSCLHNHSCIAISTFNLISQVLLQWPQLRFSLFCLRSDVSLPVKNPISTVTEFLNLCLGGTNAPVCPGGYVEK
jgi:hypothetical protein